mmetsp:Transcript_20254/g.40419  ORF Transcript_20254/g.40419 Transcript_20254/m.40419 type:complete len:261 (+) Transcript_20254:2197-2979(+)
MNSSSFFFICLRRLRVRGAMFFWRTSIMVRMSKSVSFTPVRAIFMSALSPTLTLAIATARNSTPRTMKALFSRATMGSCRTSDFEEECGSVVAEDRDFPSFFSPVFTADVILSFVRTPRRSSMMEKSAARWCLSSLPVSFTDEARSSSTLSSAVGMVHPTSAPCPFSSSSDSPPPPMPSSDAGIAVVPIRSTTSMQEDMKELKSSPRLGLSLMARKREDNRTSTSERVRPRPVPLFLKTVLPSPFTPSVTADMKFVRIWR